MTNEDSLPSMELLAVARRVAPGWLARLVAGVVDAPGAGITPGGAGERSSRPDRESQRAVLDAAIAKAERTLLEELSALLSTDVEQQRQNPLALFRAATRPLTAALVELGYPARTRDPFDAERFPDDVYGLVPATWSDIEADLVPVGLTWGAWKAMVILHRRRAGEADRSG